MASITPGYKHIPPGWTGCKLSCEQAAQATAKPTTPLISNGVGPSKSCTALNHTPHTQPYTVTCVYIKYVSLYVAGMEEGLLSQTPGKESLNPSSE